MMIQCASTIAVQLCSSDAVDLQLITPMDGESLDVGDNHVLQRGRERMFNDMFRAESSIEVSKLIPSCPDSIVGLLRSFRSLYSSTVTCALATPLEFL